MARPTKLDRSALQLFLSQNGGWTEEGDALVRSFTFPDFSSALAFTVRVGLLAEKRDHHPDILLGWGKARVTWTTHDARGITELDVDLATETDKLG